MGFRRVGGALAFAMLCSLAALYVWARARLAPPPDLAPDLTRDLTEELPFLVGNKTYRSYYLGTDPISNGIRRRYRTWPFDLPSAASCLSDPLAPGEVPTDQRLAWDRLLAVQAIEVCLARVLNRFDSAEPALAWLAAQGLKANGESSPEVPGTGHTYWFDWGPQMPGGPGPWRDSLNWAELFNLGAVSVMVDVCEPTNECQQLDDPHQSAPFFRAEVAAHSKYQE